MTTVSLALTDSATMYRRSLRRIVRYPSMTLIVVGLPIVLLLLFVYVFGRTLGNGLAGGVGGVGGVGGGVGAGVGAGGRSAYVDYVTPGILLMTVAGTAQGTAISVAMDMRAGIIARFRTMAIARASVLTGHVLGSVTQALLSLVVVVAVAIGIGFRPTADVVDWLAAGGILGLAALSLAWLSVALGLVSKSVETASNLPMFLTLLPFLGSGFVPTDSMPAGLRWFAEYQPFTPVIETVRGLLLGTPIGANALLAVLWSVGIGGASYLWAKRLFGRRPAH